MNTVTQSEVRTISGGSPEEVCAEVLPTLGREAQASWLVAWGRERSEAWSPLAFWEPRLPMGVVLQPGAVAPDVPDLRQAAILRRTAQVDRVGGLAVPIAGVVVVGKVANVKAAARAWQRYETALFSGLEQGRWRARWRRVADWSSEVVRVREEGDWVRAWQAGASLLADVPKQALRHQSGETIFASAAARHQPSSTDALTLQVAPGYTWVLGIDARHPSWEIAHTMATLLQASAFAVREWHSLRDAASTDPLTGLLNRAGFTQAVEDDLAAGLEGVLALYDLDHFKELNDSKGHPEGDRALVTLAAAWGKGLRPSDKAARLGGDEFAVWAPNLPEAGATSWIERQIASLPLAEFGLSISCGCAGSRGERNLAGVYQVADAALYAAKEEAHRTGRSAIRVSVPQ